MTKNTQFEVENLNLFEFLIYDIFVLSRFSTQISQMKS